jgi:hypothetical protein
MIDLRESGHFLVHLLPCGFRPHIRSPQGVFEWSRAVLVSNPQGGPWRCGTCELSN